jgi:putative ABC transport system substrate-binding protein
MNKVGWSSIVAAAMLLAFAVIAEAQQLKKVPRIGYLCPTTASSLLVRTEAFRQGLKELGYVEGKDIAIEYRWLR